MVVPRPLKHRATDNFSPLQQAGILQHVLDYVGPGHWCFVAEVRSLWRDVCASDTRRELPLPRQYYARSVAYVPQMTVFSAVFTSPSCVRHAHAHGLDYATEWCERAAGRYGDIATLQTAHELGMAYTDLAIGAADCNQLAVVQFLQAQGCPLSESLFHLAAERGHIAMCAYLHAAQCPWSNVICNSAAYGGSLNTLRWLRERGCPWSTYAVSICAACSGSIDLMLYLQQQGVVFNAEMLRDMLNAAGAHNELAAAQWLRQRGAAWPAVLYDDMMPWSGDALLWARAEGCTSPTAWPARNAIDEAQPED
jgi:hypothetical protein